MQLPWLKKKNDRYSELMSMTASQLRTMLRKANLSPTGNKPELVERIVDLETTPDVAEEE